MLPTMAQSPTASEATVDDLQSALDAAVRGIAALAPLDDVLQIIVERVRPLVGAQYAALGIIDPNGRIERFITSGLDEETRRRIGALPEGHGLLGLIIRENRSFRIPDINLDPRRHGFPANHPPMKSFLGVPISLRGVSLGRLYLTNKIGADEFSEGDQALVEIFALHAGIAMENARLHEQLQRLAIVDERERISKDLHDGIIQNLYAVGLSLEDVVEDLASQEDGSAAKVGRAIDSIHHSIQDIRNFIFGLRPELLENASLVEGLAILVEEQRLNSMVDLELHAPEGMIQPPPAVTSHLLAIASEALSNVVRHSRATRALVTVIPLGHDSWELRVEDNGAGFAPSASTKMGHQGLANIRDRAERIGGDLVIESDPGRGTSVTVRIPHHP
jgi:two-component system, NarL family, sensor histidine kinase DevS